MSFERWFELDRPQRDGAVAGRVEKCHGIDVKFPPPLSAATIHPRVRGFVMTGWVLAVRKGRTVAVKAMLPY